MSSLKLFLLGPPRLERDGEPLEIDARKSVALLAYLVITGQSYTRDALATLLWPESEPGRGRAILRRNLSALRKTLAGEWLTVSRDTIGIDPNAEVWLDVKRFRHLLQTWKAHGHPLDDVCPDCLADLEQAVQLYKSDFLEGFTLRDSVNFDDWQSFEAESLRQELASALARMVHGYSAHGQHVGEEPGNLPLLEFALTSLWDHERAWMLSHDGYEAIGRVQGALTRHADEVYDRLSSDEQPAARRIFTQLVRPGEGTEDTRRLARLNELHDTDWSLVQGLADARLVVTGRDSSGQETVEVAHEALIAGLRRLRSWMEEDRAFRAWQERLRASLRSWQASEQDQGALLRGAPLAEAEGWLAQQPAGLRPVERAYIDASVEFRERQQVKREYQRQRELALERRSRRLLAIVAGVLAVAVVVILAFAAYSLLLRRQALEAYSLSLAASAREVLDSQDTVAALELALEANQIHSPPQAAQRILMDAAYSPGARWGAVLASFLTDV